MTRASAGWVLAIALASSGASCRHFDVCGTSLPCSDVADRGGGGGQSVPGASHGGTSNASDSGAFNADAPNAGAGGHEEPNAPDCEAPFAECDASPLTSCETNLSNSPLHCGDCNQPCEAGVCARGGCNSWSLVASDLYRASQALALGKDFVFFAASPELAHGLRLDLLRFDRQTSDVKVCISQGFVSIDDLLVVGSRLYVVEGSRLWSVDLDGNDLRQEAIQGSAFATSGNQLFFADDEAVYQRTADGSGALFFDTRPADPTIGGDPQVLVIATNDTVDDRPQYAVYERRAPSDDVTLLEEGLGTVDFVMASAGRAFWLVDPGDGAPRRLKSQAEHVATIELDPAETIDSLDVADSWLVLTWSRRGRHGLRFVPLASPQNTVQLATTSAITSLHAWGSELWFYDTGERALAHAPLDSLYRWATAQDAPELDP